MNKIDKRSMTAITGAAEKLDALLADYELEREIASAKFGQMIDAINDAREELRGMLEDEANAAEAYADDRSEKWQESDRGQAYNEWKDRLRSLADDAATDFEGPEFTEIDEPSWLADVKDGEFSEFEFEG
jgi:F0F1-type ATP synthase membrane subunit b/b'